MTTYQVWIEIEELDDDGEVVPDTSHSFDLGFGPTFTARQLSEATAVASVMHAVGSSMSVKGFPETLSTLVDYAIETLETQVAIGKALDFLNPRR